MDCQSTFSKQLWQHFSHFAKEADESSNLTANHQRNQLNKGRITPFSG